MEIATISQGTDTVSAYFTKWKELWAEYDAIVAFRIVDVLVIKSTRITCNNKNC